MLYFRIQETEQQVNIILAETQLLVIVVDLYINSFKKVFY